MGKCFRCGGEVPEPDLKEAVAQEQDYREKFDENDEERVLICIPCADELEELDD